MNLRPLKVNCLIERSFYFIILTFFYSILFCSGDEPMDTEPSPAPTPAAAYDPKEEKKKREEEQKRREEQAKYDALPAEKKQVINVFDYKYFNVYMY